MLNRFKKSLIASVLIGLAGHSAVADGVIHDSVEAISDGRGGTNIAFSDNGAVLLANPAGILNAEGCGLFEVAGDTLITDLHFSNPINPDTSAHIRPLVLPAVVAGSIFTFSLTLGDYITPTLVSNTKFIGNVVYDLVGVAGNSPLAAAYTMVPVTIMLVFLLVARRLGAFEAL